MGSLRSPATASGLVEGRSRSVRRIDEYHRGRFGVDPQFANGGARSGRDAGDDRVRPAIRLDASAGLEEPTVLRDQRVHGTGGARKVAGGVLPVDHVGADPNAPASLGRAGEANREPPVCPDREPVDVHLRRKGGGPRPTRAVVDRRPERADPSHVVDAHQDAPLPGSVRADAGRCRPLRDGGPALAEIDGAWNCPPLITFGLARSVDPCA